MKTFLDVIAAWTALDVALLAIWRLAHVRSRRFGAHALASRRPTQRVYTLAPEVRVRETGPTVVRAGRR